MVIPKITKTTTLSKLISTEKAYLSPLLGLDYDFVWCGYYIIGSHNVWQVTLVRYMYLVYH
jgi:hypothetical protein